MQAVNFLDNEGLNVRLNLLRRLAQSITSEINEIEKKQEAVAAASHQNETEISLEEQVKRFEMDLIRFALLKTGGKQNSATEFLKIKRSTLHAKIKRYRISAESYRLLSEKFITDS